MVSPLYCIAKDEINTKVKTKIAIPPKSIIVNCEKFNLALVGYGLVLVNRNNVQDSHDLQLIKYIWVLGSVLLRFWLEIKLSETNVF